MLAQGCDLTVCLFLCTHESTADEHGEREVADILFCLLNHTMTSASHSVLA